ncbi:MAG: glycoside hydrolase family 31 protein [Alistipes sp.]|jgi:alpha-glucosidase|nr:glycoside hydrolase family 31 protein [Alistipes sp.]
MKRIITLCLVLVASAQLWAQSSSTLTIPRTEGEYWWGGAVGYGWRMPYLTPVAPFDLSRDNSNNQVCPLLVSSTGRWLWSDVPFTFEVKEDGSIVVTSQYEELSIRQAADASLRGAYLEAATGNFPSDGTLPNELFFTMPQYNTWMELAYDQNQEDILQYARDVVANGFPTGVLMIDDNWQQNYGNFDFRPDKFPDPKGMVDELHAMGFKVMLWVCPFVSPDSSEYRDLSRKGYLIRKQGSREPAVLSWWNGQSACYDLTNPEAFDHYVNILKGMQAEYGIDGFKLDAGDNAIYTRAPIDSWDKDALSVDHTTKWVEVGLQFPFNEYRAGWKMGGKPLVQRLGDKDYSWEAVQALVPDMIAAGLMGYAYACPDMIGGGQVGSFRGLGSDDFDQELIVRSAQTHTLMPMMQFSVAPWRILSDENLAIVQEMARLHERFGEYIIECARASSHNSEPIVRHMEYSFPGQGFAECKDQFMLGDKYLVAPMVKPGTSREVKLPRGNWLDDQGRRHRGGRTITIDVPLSRLPHFEKL